MKKYALYLFDFDGTLFDTLDSIKCVYREKTALFNAKIIEEDFPMYLGLSLPRFMRHVGIDPSKEKEFCDAFNKAVLDKNITSKTKLYFDTLDLFKYLYKNNVKHGIVTGSGNVRVHDILDYFKLDFNKLSSCVGNERYKHPKPDPEPILVALKDTGFINRKSEVLFIGDAEQDKLCAEAAGVDYIQINRGKNGGDINSLLDIFK